MSIRSMLRPLALLVMLVCASISSAQTTNGGSSGASTDNSDLKQVEALLIARRDYQHTLEQLRAHYIKTEDWERVQWCEEELREYHRINHHAYRLDLDVPPPTLQGNTNIPEANKLLTRVKSEYMDRGYGMDYIDNQRRAELLLQELFTLYPASDKIDEAAYMLGELYESKAFKQYRRAALYYERCFQWTPSTPFDARLRAARLYDNVLHERAHAIEIYKDITTHETDSEQIEEASKRLKALSGTR